MPLPVRVLCNAQAVHPTHALAMDVVMRKATALVLPGMRVTTAMLRALLLTRQLPRAITHMGCANRTTTHVYATSLLEELIVHRPAALRTATNEESATAQRDVAASLGTLAMLVKACVLGATKHLVAEFIVESAMLLVYVFAHPDSSDPIAQKHVRKHSSECATVKGFVETLAYVNARLASMGIAVRP